jgi:hypothetical protein
MNSLTPDIFREAGPATSNNGDLREMDTSFPRPELDRLAPSESNVPKVSDMPATVGEETASPLPALSAGLTSSGPVTPDLSGYPRDPRELDTPYPRTDDLVGIVVRTDAT